MIRYKAKFMVHDGENVRIPREKRHNENFWCSFNTQKQLIMCSIIYLGEDEIMQQHKWYEGIIELPYGEKFPPYGQEFEECINLAENYYINCADNIVGECKLEEVIEVISDKFDIRKDDRGNY